MLAESNGGGGGAGGGGQMVNNTGQTNGHFGNFGTGNTGGHPVFPAVQQNTNAHSGSQEAFRNGQMNSPSNATPKYYDNVHFPEGGKTSPSHRGGSSPNGGPLGGSEFNRHTSPTGQVSPPLAMNGVLLNLDDLPNRTASPSRMPSTRSLDDRAVAPSNGKGATNGTGSHGRPGTTALADLQPKDKRPQRLALLGVCLTGLGTLLAVTSLSTSQWARVAGLAGGYLGPFLACQDSYKGQSECRPHSSFQPAHAAVFAGVCSALCFVLALISTVLSLAIFWMHTSGQRVLLKYKHATALRMLCTGMAGCLSLVAVVAFVVEVSLVGGMVAGQPTSAHSLSWGFYVQVLATLALWVAGGASSAEWQRSRKLGGDPTMVNRDPQGIHAHTISNPNFKEDPSKQGIRTVSGTVKNVPPLVVRNASPDGSISPSVYSSSSDRSMSPSGYSQNPSKSASFKKARTVLPTPTEIHRSNGVSGVTGQPYMLGSGVNGYSAPSPGLAKRSIFDFNNKIIKSKTPTTRSRSPVGRSGGSRSRSSDGRSPKNVRKTHGRPDDPLAFVPFDPNRAPLRSSLRKPKPSSAPPPPEGAAADATDGGTEEGGIPNPAFAQTSPVMKKKVRIHTQSTAV